MVSPDYRISSHLIRDIVLASHIKPLEKKDRLDQIERFTQPWNIHGKKSSKEVNAENAGTKVSPSMDDGILGGYMQTLFMPFRINNIVQHFLSSDSIKVTLKWP